METRSANFSNGGVCNNVEILSSPQPVACRKKAVGTMITKQINCTINGMKVSPQEAHALTLEKLANIVHNLGNFS